MLVQRGVKWLLFNLVMCCHRWLENVDLCARAVLLLPDVKKYISAVTSEKYSKPNNVSYEVVRNSCTSDALLCAKLKFFNSVAKQMSPFLTLYQTDKPMAPFISGDLYKLLKALMKTFVKPAVMKDSCETGFSRGIKSEE